MPALVGGFFRRGHVHVILILLVTTYTAQRFYTLYRSGLSTTGQSNETFLEGSVKRRTGGGRFRHPSKLPCLVINISSAKAKFHFKNGSATVNHLLVNFNRLIGIIWKSVPETVLTSSSPNTTITEIILYSIQANNRPGLWQGEKYKMLDTHEPKRGNLGQVISSLTDVMEPLLTKCHSIITVVLFVKNFFPIVSLTFWAAKSDRLAFKKQHGGKIGEKANVLGNAKNTRNYISTSLATGLVSQNTRVLNSLSLNKVVSIPFFRYYSVQDLPLTEDRPNISNEPIPLVNSSFSREIEEIVTQKQKELVQLAEILGPLHSEVLKLQLILVRSKAFRIHAYNLMTSKKGSATPGVDGEILNSKKDKLEQRDQMISYLREMVYHPNRYKPSPIRRVWITKPGKSEQISIPTIKERALQTLVNLVLLPLVELTSDPNSYGFRPYRDTKMAVAAVRANLRTIDVDKSQAAISRRYNTKTRLGRHLKKDEERWILDADIKGFFDHINHKWLLDNLFLHPILKGFVEIWLKAKILDQNTYTDPVSGTPQGGIIYPSLVNFTLNGLEKVINESIKPLTKSKEQRIQIKLGDGTKTRIAIGLSFIRFADDFVVIARSKHILKKYIVPAINKFLGERGLHLNPQNTKIVTLSAPNAQLNFLGYTFKYQDYWSAKRTVMFTKHSGERGIALYPQREKVISIIRELKEIFAKAQNWSAITLITTLNPKIRGWGNYFNMGNSSHYRSVVREALYRLTWKWAKTKHPTLGKKILAQMYFLSSLKRDDNKIIEDKTIKRDKLNTSFCDSIKEPGSNKKIKTQLWTFHGLSRSKSKYSKNANRIFYLVNPSKSAKLLSAKHYILPHKLRPVHAFHSKLAELIKYKLDLNLMETAKAETLKEKLYNTQKGLCGLCNKTIEYSTLLMNKTHIHHIEPISKGGNKFKLSNLMLAHATCHRAHKQDLA